MPTDAVAVRESPPPRHGPPVAVLIEVPTLRARPARRPRSSPPMPGRRRLRRKVRLGAYLALLALPAAAIGVRLVGREISSAEPPAPVVRLSAAIEPVVVREPEPSAIEPPPIIVLAPEHVTAEPPAYGGGRHAGN